MPELPEVETTRRGVAPHIEGLCLEHIAIRQPQLRWPVPVEQLQSAVGLPVLAVRRRGKYLLLEFSSGCILLHLGMSGSLRVLNPAPMPAKHDHLDFVFKNSVTLRLTDPRRFGAVLWSEGQQTHERLMKLGPEPLESVFNVQILISACRGRRAAIKQVIMDSQVVVGVGNIYANEALFHAGIDPRREAGKISAARLQHLVERIKQVLSEAIEQGGTTLKDFVNTEGKPGYFKQSLYVYGRAGLPCLVCQAPLAEVRLGQRSTVFCRQCQR